MPVRLGAGPGVQRGMKDYDKSSFLWRAGKDSAQGLVAVTVVKKEEMAYPADPQENLSMELGDVSL